MNHIALLICGTVLMFVSLLCEKEWKPSVWSAGAILVAMSIATEVNILNP